MKNKKNTILVAALAVLLTITPFASHKAEAAGNWTDTRVDIYFDGQGEGRMTEIRGKWDDTSSYYYNSDSSCAMLVSVWGSRGNGGYERDCSIEPNKRVNVGVSSYLLNWVNEWGFSHCGLLLKPVTGTGRAANIRGWWSPDSI